MWRQTPLEESAVGIPLMAAHLLTFDWSTLTLCPIEKREVFHAKCRPPDAATETAQRLPTL
jgi:hypothetical protein